MGLPSASDPGCFVLGPGGFGLMGRGPLSRRPDRLLARNGPAILACFDSVLCERGPQPNARSASVGLLLLWRIEELRSRDPRLNPISMRRRDEIGFSRGSLDLTGSCGASLLPQTLGRSLRPVQGNIRGQSSRALARRASGWGPVSQRTESKQARMADPFRATRRSGRREMGPRPVSPKPLGPRTKARGSEASGVSRDPATLSPLNTRSDESLDAHA